MLQPILLSLLLIGANPDPYRLENPSRLQNVQMILEVAEEFRHDPYELLAIAYTESRLNERAVSSTGDVGLLQVNCRVWARKFGYSSIFECKKDMKVPRTNIIAAMKILKEHERKYKQCRRYRKWRYRCYNGGPGWPISKNREKIEKYSAAVMKRLYVFKTKYEPYLVTLTGMMNNPHYNLTQKTCQPMMTQDSFITLVSTKELTQK